MSILGAVPTTTPSRDSRLGLSIFREPGRNHTRVDLALLASLPLNLFETYNNHPTSAPRVSKSSPPISPHQTPSSCCLIPGSTLTPLPQHRPSGTLIPTKTMAEAVSAVVSAMSSGLFGRDSVSGQAGVLEGANPTHYDKKNPITLFIIQVSKRPTGSVRPDMARPVGTEVSLPAMPCHAVMHRSSPRCLCTTGYACIRDSRLTDMTDRRVS